MSGTRLARREQREKILHTAVKNGWIDLDEHRLALALQNMALSSVQDAVAILPPQAPALRLVAPTPPTPWLLNLHTMLQFSRTQTEWEKWGANVAATTLLKDALRNEVLKKLGKPEQGQEWTAWKQACELVRAAVKTGVHEDLIRSRLAALYRIAPPGVIQVLWGSNHEAHQVADDGCAPQCVFDDKFDDSTSHKRKKPM
ncbi:MAG: hypothetical protein LWW81_15785 [Rhodocyclales bacterium]|nr:hypothetical protein [Rhodocyclales bacterium]